jgi:hypothetical protein
MGSTMSLAPKAVMAVFIAPFPKTKIQAAELRMFAFCSLLVLVLRINFLGLQVRLCTAFSGISVGDCILPCVRKNGKEKSNLVMS